MGSRKKKLSDIGWVLFYPLWNGVEFQTWLQLPPVSSSTVPECWRTTWEEKAKEGCVNWAKNSFENRNTALELLTQPNSLTLPSVWESVRVQLYIMEDPFPDDHSWPAGLWKRKGQSGSRRRSEWSSGVLRQARCTWAFQGAGSKVLGVHGSPEQQELYQVWFVEQERQNAELHNSETQVCTFAPRAARYWWAPTEGWGQEGHEVLNEVGNEDRQAGCSVHLILIINSSLHPPFTPGPPPSISATKIKLGQRFKELPENISQLNWINLIWGSSKIFVARC